MKELHNITYHQVPEGEEKQITSVSGNCMRQLHVGVESEGEMNIRRWAERGKRRATHGRVKHELKSMA